MQERKQDAGTASLEARLKASEDWRSQQDARMQLEDKWKAGQEAAFNHWRNENDARVRVEEDWKALHESRMVNVRFTALLCSRAYLEQARAGTDKFASVVPHKQAVSSASCLSCLRLVAQPAGSAHTCLGLML